MRSCCYRWIFGVFLAVTSLHCFPQSIPPTADVIQIPSYGYGGQIFSSAAAACVAAGQARAIELGGTSSGFSYIGNSQCRGDTSTHNNVYALIDVVETCPAGYSATGNQCVKYTCQAGYVLNGSMCDPELQCPPGQSKWNGQCKPDCLFLQRRDQTTGECNCNREGNTSIGINEYVDTSGEGPLPSKVCVHGCEFNIGEGIGMGAQFWAGQRTTATGAVCDPSKALVDKPQPPKNKPPCAADQGVMTSSSGTVACVPQGTPGAKKPEVEVKKKKETYPDGSVKETTETKTKDTNTGATNTSTTTTSTGGLSGSSGTSTSEEDKKPTTGGTDDGECEGDDCGEDDGPEFEEPEGDGLYEKGDRTIRDALNDFVTGITGAPIYNTAATWFNVMAMPSGCGGMLTNVPLLNITISLDEYLCGPSAQTIVQIAGVVVLALAAFAAFRIGFL